MKTIIDIQKIEHDPDSLEYTVGSHKIVIYKVQSAIPGFPWRVSIDNEIKKTFFAHCHSAETFMIAQLAALKEFANNIFTIKSGQNSELLIVCQCGKEKHGFFKHSDWCKMSPDYKP